MFGTEDLTYCEGRSLSQYEPSRLYSQDQIDHYIADLVEGRKKFTNEIIREGLEAEIIKEAEKSFEISQAKKPPAVGVPASTPSADNGRIKIDTSFPRSMFSDLSPATRPSRSFRN